MIGVRLRIIFGGFSGELFHLSNFMEVATNFTEGYSGFSEDICRILSNQKNIEYVQELPSFDTYCPLTPTWKLENTGEWSLVIISSVHPVKMFAIFIPIYLIFISEREFVCGGWGLVLRRSILRRNFS